MSVNGNKSILIVEDQPMVANALKMILKIDGYDVVIATNGHEALEVYQPGKFALIFTDYKMPGMSGHELAATIKSRDATQRIILITAYSDSHTTIIAQRTSILCSKSRGRWMRSARPSRP